MVEGELMVTCAHVPASCYLTVPGAWQGACKEMGFFLLFSSNSKGDQRACLQQVLYFSLSS